MKLLLITDEKYSDLNLKFNFLSKNHILLTSQIESNSFLQDDMLLKMIFSFENVYGKIDAFLIPVSLGGVHTEFWGLKLGMLIRFAFENEDICTKPIIFISTSSRAELMELSSYSSVLIFSETYLCPFNDFEIQNTIEAAKSTTIHKIVLQLDKIQIDKPIETSRHSIANDWALYRLADVFGILHKIEMSYNFISKINTPYFRLLLNRVHYKKSKGIKKILSVLPTIEKGKFLLIDDKASTGWFEVLKHLLMQMNPDNELFFIDKIIKNEDGQIDLQGILENISTSDYDLIFLDLRLFDEEDSFGLNNISNIEKFSGAQILFTIKDSNPSIPIIMFTASQQAWNFIQLLELGADGYFIKESPENIFSDDLLFQNIVGLSQEVLELTKKGRILNWFFTNSNELKNKLDNISFNPVLRDRIKEKLDIAFSLMLGKQNRVQRKYLYTDFELAFLVYWSCLNEFQMGFIGKYDGENDYSIQGRYDLIRNSESLIQYIPPRDGPTRQTFEWRTRFTDGRRMPNINLRSSPIRLDSRAKDHLKNISNIIPAYILLKFGNSKQNMVDHFCVLNEIRNRLDFTHSDDSLITSFTIETARDKQQAIEDCKNMFRLIYFLITEAELI